MKKRQFVFIFALSFLCFLIWIIGEFLIGEFLNSFGISVGWAVFCLVACCAYSLWKCPREPEEDDSEEDDAEQAQEAEKEPVKKDRDCI